MHQTCAVQCFGQASAPRNDVMLLHHRHAAIHAEDLTGDIRGFV